VTEDLKSRQHAKASAAKAAQLCMLKQNLWASTINHSLGNTYNTAAEANASKHPNTKLQLQTIKETKHNNKPIDPPVAAQPRRRTCPASCQAAFQIESHAKKRFVSKNELHSKKLLLRADSTRGANATRSVRCQLHSERLRGRGAITCWSAPQVAGTARDNVSMPGGWMDDDDDDGDGGGGGDGDGDDDSHGVSLACCGVALDAVDI
jgi:hypothetical protein